MGTNGPVVRSADWVVEGVAGAPELFAGTGFRDGDVVPNLVGYEYDGLWTAGAGAEPPPGLRVLGRARVIASDPPPDSLAFAVAYDFAAPARPQPGRLTTRVEATSGLAAARSRTASRSAPVPKPWMTTTWSRPARAASSR